MIFLCIPWIVLAYMLGGQVNKLFRPICVPIILLACFIFFDTTHLWYVILPSLLYGGILTLGYGVDSKLMKWFKHEQTVRIILGVLVGIPVLLTVVLTHNIYGLIGFPLIVSCSCIRMGKWVTIGDFDILLVDIFRGLAVGIGMSLALI